MQFFFFLTRTSQYLSRSCIDFENSNENLYCAIKLIFYIRFDGRKNDLLYEHLLDLDRFTVSVRTRYRFFFFCTEQSSLGVVAIKIIKSTFE